jgi:hypothetical protein
VIAGRLLPLAVASGLIATLIATLCCQATVASVGSWTPGTYLEAESGELSAGFVVGDDLTASAGHFLEAQTGTMSEDAPGASHATYELKITTAGTYFIWGRIRSPSTSTNRFWVQLDGGTPFKWRITVGDIWFWDRLHDDFNYGTPLTFPLSAGTHTLVISNCVDGVELDRIFYTPNEETPPGNTTPCDPPNSIDLPGGCQPSCGSQGGDTCGPAACSGLPPLPAYDCDVCCIGP